MKVKAIEGNRKLWTETDNRALVKLYNNMLTVQASDEKLVKAPLLRALAAELGRSQGSIECKCMNVSAIRQNLLGLPIVKGFKALDNYNHDLAEMVCADNDVEYLRK